MRKSLIGLLSIVMLLSIFGFVACDSANEPKHEHAFTQQVVNDTYLKTPATCKAKAVYFKSCSCGVKGTETFENGELGAHNFSAEWTKDDSLHFKACLTEGCEEKIEQGTHALNNGVCECGFVDESRHTHIYNKQVEDEKFIKTPATCKVKGVYFISCACGLKGTETFVSAQFGAHDFSKEWTKTQDKHYKVCLTEGCTEKSEEATHTYNNNLCVCGDISESSTSTGLATVTEKQWEKAFDFENVTVEWVMVDNAGNQTVIYYVDGANAIMHDLASGQMTDQLGPDGFRSMFNYKSAFNTAQYNNGVYYIAVYDIYGNGQTLYKNSTFTFSDGLLVKLEVTMEEKQGSISYVMNFSKHGTTILPDYTPSNPSGGNSGTNNTDPGGGDQDPNRPGNPNADKANFILACDSNNFENFTYRFEMATASGVSSIKPFFEIDGPKERCTVMLESSVSSIYCINGEWCTYDKQNGMKALDENDPLQAYAGMRDTFKTFLKLVQNNAEQFVYNQAKATFVFSAGGVTIEISIEDKKIDKMFVIQGQSTYGYYFEQYGYTRIDIPGIK